MSDVKINPTGVTCIWGGRGSGKSTHARTHITPQVAKSHRIAVIDPMAVGEGVHMRAKDFAQALYDGQRNVILATGAPDEAVAAIYAAYAHSSKSDPIYIVCDEAPQYLNRDRAGLSKIMFQGRHRGFGMCLIGQKVSAITPTIRGQADTTFWMRLSEHNDVKLAGQVLGPDKAALLRDFKAGEFTRQ